MRTHKPDKIMIKARDIFLAEVKNKLPEAGEILETFDESGSNPELCKNLYRIAHTLKGSGQTVKMWDIADAAAEMATVLTLIQDYGVHINKGVLEFLKGRLAEIKECISVYDSKLKLCDNTKDKILQQKEKILLVDDDLSITTLIKESLEKEGFFVIVSHDALSAESILKEEKPDLIILDVVLPHESGIEFCRRIRSNYHYQFVPIIFLSIKTELIDRLAGFATGADDYICKPFQMEELIARIRVSLNRIATCSELILQDELTQVYNRRYLQQRLEEEIARSQRTGSIFSIAMLDLDNFKKVNDTWGHSAGDEVLQCFVKRISKGLRITDNICRFGGDEFVIILPDTNEKAAQMVVERLNSLISMGPLECKKNENSVPVRCSIGLATYPVNGKDPENLLEYADENLYYEKRKNLTT